MESMVNLVTSRAILPRLAIVMSVVTVANALANRTPGDPLANRSGDRSPVHELLGIGETATPQPRATTKPTSPSTSRFTPIEDPFSDREQTAPPSMPPPSGIEFGSIPLIRDDETSFEYVLDRLINGAQKAAETRGLPVPSAIDLRLTYRAYARSLVETLAAMGAEEQNYVFYGSG